MKLELLTLCDFAKGEPNGKLNIIGTFDRILAPQVPSPAPLCAIAARLRFEAIERGSKTVTISFVDSDGVRVIPDMNVQMNIQVPPNETSATANVVVMLAQVNLPSYGEYSIDLAVDARLEGSIPLFVQRPVQQPSTGQPFSAPP